MLVTLIFETVGKIDSTYTHHHAQHYLQQALHVSALFSGHHQAISTIPKTQVCMQQCFFFHLRAPKLHSDIASF